MGTKAKGTFSERTYDEFEPFCSWQREEGRDLLELHLPEFKKEQLKVRINSLRVLLITGERPVNANKWSRFCKEIQIPSNANAKEICAKFSGAKLIVTMPKNITPPPSSAQYQESDKRPNQDNFNYSNNEAAMLSKVGGNGPNMANEVGGVASGLMMSRRRMSKRTAVAVAALAAGVAVGVYVACKYCWS